MIDTITIDVYKDGDEEELNSLFCNVFSKKRSLREWEWKFKESPIDSRPFIILARSSGKIIGQYACISFWLKYQDTFVKALQPVDNFVHNDYRGGVKGVQAKLMQKSNENAVENGVAVGFGFPNRTGYVIGKRLFKHKDLIKIEVLFKRLSWRSALKRRMKWSFPANLVGWISSLVIRVFLATGRKSVAGVKYTWVSTFDESINLFWEKVKDQYAIMVKRDFNYLHWRYCRKPDTTYHILQAELDGSIVGLIIVKYEDYEGARIGFVMELLASKDYTAADSLLKRGLIFLSRNKVDFVLARVSSSDPVKRVFYKKGFSPKEGVWNSHIVYVTYSSHVKASVLRDTSLWHVSFGDCDAA
ncbi:MAG: GNAT family N-acetyltransferase [Candidatus Brocadiaceae bacterium]|nr:GNAT family N-acetyltransferase [Candidatus Brocadiaceae bacterium]